MISIQDDATAGTDVGTHTQRLLHDSTTGATFLAGEVWCYRNDRNVVHASIGFDPGDERAPSCIVNGLREVMVPDHIAYLYVFIGNHIVR